MNTQTSDKEAAKKPQIVDKRNEYHIYSWRCYPGGLQHREERTEKRLKYTSLDIDI